MTEGRRSGKQKKVKRKLKVAFIGGVWSRQGGGGKLQKLGRVDRYRGGGATAVVEKREMEERKGGDRTRANGRAREDKEMVGE